MTTRPTATAAGARCYVSLPGSFRAVRPAQRGVTVAPSPVVTTIPGAIAPVASASR